AAPKITKPSISVVTETCRLPILRGSSRRCQMRASRSFQFARAKAENKLPKKYLPAENIPQVFAQKIGRRAGEHANGLVTEHHNKSIDLISAQIRCVRTSTDERKKFKRGHRRLLKHWSMTHRVNDHIDRRLVGMQAVFCRITRVVDPLKSVAHIG